MRFILHFQRVDLTKRVFSYNTTFFAQSGVRNPFLISAVTTIVNVLSTPVSFYTIERFGRRPLLIWGAVVMGVCQLVVASVCTAEPDTHNLSRSADYTLITFVCIYIFSFASTWGPVGWVVVGEIYPLPIRAKAVAISTAGNWLWNCALASIAPYLVDPQQGDLGGKVFYVRTSVILVVYSLSAFSDLGLCLPYRLCTFRLLLCARKYVEAFLEDPLIQS